MEIKPAKTPTADVVIYEYGCRLDKESRGHVDQQIFMARRLYNDIVACVRGIYDEMQAFVLAHAGDDARNAQQTIDQLTADFDAAKAKDDEVAIKCIAEARRLQWRELSALLKAVRKEHRASIQQQFLARIGRNAGCDTYQLRSRAVAEGLGWATANAILDAGLLAWSKSMVQGRPPRFALGVDKEQDSLTLQFTTAGGLAVADILAGKHGEFALGSPATGAGKRHYGEFRFRLGAAKAGVNATGTWQYHRPLPADASAGLARLVRRRIGKDYRYTLQLMIKLPAPIQIDTEDRSPLATVHFGWAHDVSGRRVAGIADSADPGGAIVLQLPAEIETALQRSSDIQGERDAARDVLVPQLKAKLVLPDSVDMRLQEDFAGLRKLPPNHISSNRLQRFCNALRRASIELPDWLETWRKEDRMRWQSHTHIARRARNFRKDFYRNTAAQLARRYSAIAIEPLDLKIAATKVNPVTGEKSEFSAKVRAGRVVAALYELESAIRWAAAKHGTALLEISGKTASSCSICGSDAIVADEDDLQTLHCEGCGADLDRKQNGAALVWQHVNAGYEYAVEDYWMAHQETVREKAEKLTEKKAKLIAGRANARTRSAGETE